MTHEVGKSSRVHDAIGDLIKYTKENHSFLNLWCYLLRLFNRHFFGRVVNQSLTDYRRIVSWHLLLPVKKNSKEDLFRQCMGQVYPQQHHLPIIRGGEAFTIQFYEAIEYIRCLGRQPNQLMENTIFKDIIHYI